MERIRTLGDICKTKGICFQKTILGADYCSLAYARLIECKNLGKKSPDDLCYCALEKGIEN